MVRGLRTERESAELLARDVLTYAEILAIKKRMTGYSKMSEAHKKDTEDAEFKDEYRITPEHTAKGLEYLERVAFKPSKLGEQKMRYEKEGLIDEAIRKNSPMGYRELSILLQFNHFTFTGFYDATTMYQRDSGFKSLYPLWKCYDKDGDSFEYYIEGGVMNIIG